MSLSEIVHLSVPSGDCIVAVPLDCVLSTCPTSLCFPRACWKVITQPWTFTVAIPVYVVPLQQNLNSPVTEFNNNTVFGLLSSWMQTSNTDTEKLQLAVFPAVSVAVQITVDDPIGKHDPLGGTQTT